MQKIVLCILLMLRGVISWANFQPDNPAKDDYIFSEAAKYLTPTADEQQLAINKKQTKP